MNRFPHTCLIQKPPTDADNPFLSEDESYTEVYKTDRCRCYLNGQSRFRTGKAMDADYCVVIPDPEMVDIGENYKIAVHYPQNPSANTYNVVGFVKDFVRYDRNCYIYFQTVKENMIAGDIPT